MSHYLRLQCRDTNDMICSYCVCSLGDKIVKNVDWIAFSRLSNNIGSQIVETAQRGSQNRHRLVSPQPPRVLFLSRSLEQAKSELASIAQYHAI